MTIANETLAGVPARAAPVAAQQGVADHRADAAAPLPRPVRTAAQADLRGYPGFPRGSSWQVFTPGLLVQLGIFGALFVGFGLIGEVRDGVIERMRVTPASRMALLAGRVLRDAVVLLVQSTVLLAAAYAFGLRAPLGGVVLAVLLVAAVGAAFAAASYAVALLTGTEDAMASITNSLAVPLLLLSGILLPMTLAPAWLRDGLQRQPGQAHRRRPAGAVPRPRDHAHGRIGVLVGAG